MATLEGSLATAITARFGQDTHLRNYPVFNTAAPSGTPVPYTVFQIIISNRIHNMTLAMSFTSLQIRAVARTFTDVELIAGYINDAFDRLPLTLAGTDHVNANILSATSIPAYYEDGLKCCNRVLTYKLFGS